MRIFANIEKRRQIKQLFETTNQIYKQIEHCLLPSINVFYHYKFAYLGMTRSDLSVNSNDINVSFAEYKFI